MSDALLQLASGALAPTRVDRLLAAHGSPGRVVDAVLSRRTNLGDGPIAAMAVPASDRLNQLRSIGVDWTPAASDAFPERLSPFPGAPRWLFMIGAIDRRPSIGIVGTRTCTQYGLDLAAAYGRTAAIAGWAVVSGLAKGIDYVAQSSAMEVGGHCTAVLGSGIDVVYPRRHAGLYTEIATEGAIVSEYPPGTRPDGWRFPTRNRIIAGLSDVILVVEAGEKGGALITARIALDYGVSVFATPGDVDRPASVGTNLLIRDGAFPVFGPEDLAQVLDLLTPLVRHSAQNVQEVSSNS